MTDWTTSHGSDGPAGAEPVVTRRDVLGAIATVVLGTTVPGVAGSEEEQRIDDPDVSQTDPRGGPAPQWTARAVTEAVGDDNIKLLFQTQLEYFGASYDPHGDPETGPLSDGGSWQHTFGLTTQLIPVRPWYQPESYDGDYYGDSDDEVFYGPVLRTPGSTPSYSRNEMNSSFDDIIDDFASGTQVDLKAGFDDRPLDPGGDPEVGCQPEVEVSSVAPSHKLAVSARRDDNLYAFSDPSGFLSAFQSFRGLDLYQLYAQSEVEQGINRGLSEPFDEYAALKRTRDRMSDANATLNFVLSSGSLLATVFFIAGPAGPAAAAAGFTVGIAFAALQELTNIWAQSANGRGPKDGVDKTDGFANVHPIGNNPAASATVMFDLYASPGDAPIATVRARDNVQGDPPESLLGHVWFVKLPSLPDDPGYNPTDGESVELILPALGPDDPDSDAWSDVEAEQRPPSPEEHQIELFDRWVASNSNKIDPDTVEIPEGDDLIDVLRQPEKYVKPEAVPPRNGPHVSFGMDWPGKTDVVDSLPTGEFESDGSDVLLRTESGSLGRDEVVTATEQTLSASRTEHPVIEKGSVTVTFDASGTHLGGTSIERYRWDLFKRTFLGSLKESDVPTVVFEGLAEEFTARSSDGDPRVSAQQLPLRTSDGTDGTQEPGSDSWREGPLFDTEESLRTEHRFRQPGEHVMILTAEDRQGNRGQQIVPFEVKGGESDEYSGELDSELIVDENEKRIGQFTGNSGDADDAFQLRVRLLKEIELQGLPVSGGLPVPGADGPDTDRDRYAYRWSIEPAGRDGLDADGDYVPPFTDQWSADVDSQRLFIAPGDIPGDATTPGAYVVFVKVTDRITGETDVSRTEIELSSETAQSETTRGEP